MNWTAKYLENGEPVYVIGEYKYFHQAAFALGEFVKRIPNPINPWWAWVEIEGKCCSRVYLKDLEKHYGV
jgi:hypothetical protein